MDHGWSSAKQQICVTEPRRIAAINLAKRICDERSCVLGHEVGYAIRFEDCFTPGLTQCKFVTEGLLIREMMQNPLLPNYSVIILDEVHERNATMDIIIGIFSFFLILFCEVLNYAFDMFVHLSACDIDIKLTEIKTFKKILLLIK